MAAPKFTDIRAAVEPGIQTFKNIQALRQKEKEEDEAEREREDQIKFNLYANLPGLEDDIVPDKFKKEATKAALDIREQQKQLINNKESMNQYEFIDQMRNYNKKINSMNKDFAAYKEWSANWVDLKSTDDLSSGMSAADRKIILDLLTGNASPIYTDEGFAYQTEDGKQHLLKNLPKPIPVAHDKHRDIFDQMQKIGETFGKFGVGNDDQSYIDRKTATLSDFKRGLSKEDALSLGADFLKIGGLAGEYAGLLKQIAENPSLIENYEFDDRDEFGKVIGKIKGIEGYKEFITDQYGEVADNMNATLKKKYDDALKIKTNTSKGFTAALEQEITLFGPQLIGMSKAIENISKIKNIQGPPKFIGAEAETINVNDEEKAKIIVNELKRLNTTNQEKYLTRAQQLDLFKANAKSKDEMKKKSNKELEDIFNSINPDGLIFYNNSPLDVNFNDSNELYKVMLQNIPGLSPEAQQYFYNTHISNSFK